MIVQNMGIIKTTDTAEYDLSKDTFTKIKQHKQQQ
jgi:hypothetical protein